MVSMTVKENKTKTENDREDLSSFPGRPAVQRLAAVGRPYWTNKQGFQRPSKKTKRTAKTTDGPHFLVGVLAVQRRAAEGRPCWTNKQWFQ